jgi:hypothetical protein
MTAKKVLMALTASGLLVLTNAATVYAADPPPPPPAEEGAPMDMPPDPDGEVQGEGTPGVGADQGSDQGSTGTGTVDSGEMQAAPPGEPK